MIFFSGRHRRKKNETKNNQHDILSVTTNVTKNLRNIHGMSMFELDTTKYDVFKSYLNTSLFLLREL